jgi:hypothetical protein
MRSVTPQAIAAAYCRGYDSIVIAHEGVAHLEEIHHIIATEYIGFEVVDETKETVTIRKISEPSEEEFRILFRRVFHFLNTIAKEGLVAAQSADSLLCAQLAAKDRQVDKLTRYCCRMVNKKAQREFEHETIIYHLLEQLARIGDEYKQLNLYFSRHPQIERPTALLYARTNGLLEELEDVLFKYSLARLEDLQARCLRTVGDAEQIGSDRSVPDERLRTILDEILCTCTTLLALNI